MVEVITFLVAGATEPRSAGASTDLAALLAGHAVQTLEGESITLDDLEGSVVLVNFWAEWCRPCAKELPVLDQWHREYSSQGVRFAAISIGSDLRKAQRMARKLDLDMPLYHDGPKGLAKTLDIPHLPITYLVGPDGRVLAVANGSDENELASLRRALEAALPRPGAASMHSGAGDMR